MERRNFLRSFGLTSAMVAHAGVVTKETLPKEEVEKPLPLVTRQNGYHEDFHWDCVQDRLYSKVTIGKNDMKERHYAFRHTIGPDYHYDNTNMHLLGQLEQPNSFLVNRIGVVFSPATLPAARSIFAERYSMLLWIGDRMYYRSPVAFSYSVDENPNGSTESFFKLHDLPLIIAPGQQFSIEFQGTPLSPNPKIAFWAVLDGIKQRAVS